MQIEVRVEGHSCVVLFSRSLLFDCDCDRCCRRRRRQGFVHNDLSRSVPARAAASCKRRMSDGRALQRIVRPQCRRQDLLVEQQLSRRRRSLRARQRSGDWRHQRQWRAELAFSQGTGSLDLRLPGRGNSFQTETSTGSSPPKISTWGRSTASVEFTLDPTRTIDRRGHHRRAARATGAVPNRQLLGHLFSDQHRKRRADTESRLSDYRHQRA